MSALTRVKMYIAYQSTEFSNALLVVLDKQKLEFIYIRQMLTVQRCKKGQYKYNTTQV
jgi:hypothetical protein